VRKQLAGLGPGTRVYVPFGQGLYSPEMSDQVYARMHETAALLTRSGRDVVLDASYMNGKQRGAVLETAAETGADVTFILTRAEDATTRARLQNGNPTGAPFRTAAWRFTMPRPGPSSRFPIWVRPVSW
jgi:predicted kinase